jgi:hypothetical protein
MKFILMMHAPRAKVDWAALNWPPEVFKAHIGFMKRFVKELTDSGELVSAEGLAGPDQARIVRARKGDGAPEMTDGPFQRPRSFSRGTGSSTARARNGPTRLPPAPRRRRDPAVSR